MRNERCSQFANCTAVTPTNPEPCGQNFDPRLPAEQICVVGLLWARSREKAEQAWGLTELALAGQPDQTASLAEARAIFTNLAETAPVTTHSLHADMALVSLDTIEKRTAGIDAITAEDVATAHHGSVNVLRKIIQNKDSLEKSDYYSLLSETAIFVLVARQEEYIPFFGSSREEHGSTKFFNHDLAIFADGIKVPVQAKLSSKNTKGSVHMRERGVLPINWSSVVTTAVRRYQHYSHDNARLLRPPVSDANDMLEHISHLLITDAQSPFPQQTNESILLSAFCTDIHERVRDFRENLVSPAGVPLPLHDPQESFNRRTQEEREIAAHGLIAQIKEQCGDEAAVQFNISRRKGRSAIRLYIGIDRDVDYDQVVLASVTAANIEALRRREEGDVFHSIDTPAEGTTAYYALLKKTGEVTFAVLGITDAENSLQRAPRDPTIVKKVANMLTDHSQGHWERLP